MKLKDFERIANELIRIKNENKKLKKQNIKLEKRIRALEMISFRDNLTVNNNSRMIKFIFGVLDDLKKE